MAIPPFQVRQIISSDVLGNAELMRQLEELFPKESEEGNPFEVVLETEEGNGNSSSE